jgi:hypothetical protein
MPNLGGFGPQVIVNADYASRVTVPAGTLTPGILTGIPVAPTGSITADFDVVLAEKFEVVDVICRKDGAGASNTITVKNGTTAITDAIVYAADKAVTRAGTIDTASNVIAAGGTLRVTATRSAGAVTGLVTVLGFIRP